MLNEYVVLAKYALCIILSLYIWLPVYLCCYITYSFQFDYLGQKEKPILDDLQCFIVPNVAEKWMEIGIKLKVPKGVLNSIENGYNNPTSCCNKVLETWLDLGESTTWKELLEVTNHFKITLKIERYPDSLLCNSATYSSDKEVVGKLACQLQIKSIKSRYHSTPDDWPLYQPKHFTGVALIHHRRGRIKKQMIQVIASIQQQGNFALTEEALSNVTESRTECAKDLSEIFIPIENEDGTSKQPEIIVIEGAPGIGKTTLSKEIVFQWANGNVLTNIRLVSLIFLRDPQVQKMQSFEDFAAFYCNDKLAMAAINKYLTATNGRDVVIILDGYDELPEMVRLRFKNILQSKSLSNFRGMVVVTSRPNLSNDLHDLADRTVEILGFTEANRKSYINQALGDNYEEMQALTDYLNRNPAVNAYCYIPLNMTILLNLFKELSPTCELPKTQTEINKIFICITISRFIRRLQNAYIDIPNFAAVPAPYSDVFSELCHLAFRTLKGDRIVFTKTEIQSICPNLTLRPKDWNGLGLLKAVQFYDFREVARSVSFNFLHLSIQEILAAYYITLLPRRKQVQLLKAKFWDSRYFNMWVMYVGLTKGQSFEFKHFLSANMFQLFTRFSLWRSQNTVISRNIISDKVKRLHLFQCFSEAENNEMCQYVSQLLQDNKIDLSGQILTAVNSITLSFFLTQSTVKHWEIINVSQCYMRDEGFQRFHTSFTSNNRSKMCVDCLDLSSNDLSETSTASIANLAVLWNVKRLVLSTNEIQSNTVCHEISSNQDFLNKFIEVFCDNHYTLIASNIDYSRITENNNYSCLFLSKCTLGRGFNEFLLPLLQKGIDLFLYDCNLPIEQIIHHVFHKEVLSFHLLTETNMTDNDVTSIVMKYLPTTKFAVTFGDKHIPLHIYNVEAKPIKEIREILSQIRHNGTLVLHGVSHRTVGKVLNAFEEVKTIREFWFNKFITELKNKQMAQFTKILMQQHSSLTHLVITCIALTDKLSGKSAPSINNFTVLQLLNFSNCKLSKDDVMMVCNAAKTIKNLTNFNLSGNNIGDQAGETLADAIAMNVKLAKLLLSNCNMSEKCMKLILTALRKCKHLEMLGIEGNSITDSVVSHLAVLLNCNPRFQSLGISDTGLQSADLGLFTKDITSTLSFKYIDLSFNKLSHSKGIEIKPVLSNSLEYLDLSYCTLQEKIMVEVTETLLTTSNLVFINLSGNKINNLAANNITAVVSRNANISSFSLADCQVSANDLICICESMKSLSNLEYIDISFNPVNDEAAIHLAAVMLNNFQLTHVNLSNCKLQEVGYKSVLTAIGQASRLLYFDFTFTAFVSGTATDLKFSGCSLEHLCLSNCALHGKEFMKIIHISKYLKHLDISSNSITDIEASKLSEAIKLSRLQYLNISDCQLETNGLIKICNSIKKITTLTCLNFSDNQIGSYTAELLAEAMLVNEALQKLILSNCNLDAIGIMHIVVAIKQLSTLTHLDLKHNWIPEKVFLTLAEAISENQLEYLDLYNSLSDGDISVLVVAIANSITLRHINIGSSKITASLAYILSIAIEKTNLQHFTLNVDSLSDEDIVMVFKSMAKIKSLHHVDLGTFSITDNISKEIKEVTMSNKRLECFKASNLSLKPLQNENLLVILKDILCTEEIHIDGMDINNNQADMIIDILTKNASIHSFHLINFSASDSFKEKILKTLNLCTVSKLHELELSNIPDTVQMIEEVSTLLANNLDLEHLVLSKCELSEQSMLQIAEFFTNRKKLSFLDLSNNKISDKILGKVCLRIKGTHLIRLCLSGNPITGNSSGTVASSIVDLILNNFSTIKALDLSRCSLNFVTLQAIIKALKQCTLLEFLDLSNNDITGRIDLDIASIITGSPNIEYLYLCNHQFTDRTLKSYFTRMKSVSLLKIIDMRGNKVTDLTVCEIAAALYRNKSFEKLMFSDFKLSKEGFPHLAIYLPKFYELENIDIAECVLSNNEASCFAKMIKDNKKTIKTINLQSCSISDDGKYEIFNSLKVLQQLIHINISNNAIPEVVEEDLKATFTVNKNMEKIEMACCSVTKTGLDKIIDAMSSSQSLSYIDLSHSEVLQFGTKLACTISHQKTLFSLKLNNSNLTTEEIQAICKSLAQLTTLRCIDLKGIDVDNNIVPDFVAMISGNKKIERLSFPNIAYTYSGIKAIINALKLVSTLTYLDMSTIEVNSEVAKGFMELMLSNRQLKVLKLSKLRLDFKSYKVLRTFVDKFYGVDTICIFGTTFDLVTLPTLISNNEQVQHLNLANCKMLEQELTRFTNILQNNTAIQHLNLNNIVLHDNAVNKLAAAISQFIKLSHLEMSGCKLTKSGFEILTFALKFTKNLVYLNFDHNMIDSTKTAANLSEMLCNCYCLRHLHLCNCALNSMYMQKIADSIKHCTSLKHLDLSMNNITTPKVIHDIVEGIVQSSQLEHLYLPNCNLCSSDLHILFNTLMKLRKIQVLDLTPNEVDTINFENLVALMQANQDLKKLILTKINLHKIRLKSIDNNFAKIRGLDSIHITNCEIDLYDCDNIKKLLVNNSDLVETLSLENCKISNIGFCSLRQAIENISGLQCLKLSGIILTGNMMKEVVGITDRNKQLTSLDLAACIGDETDPFFFVKVISNCENLIYLNLSDNNLSYQDMENLCLVISGLASLQQLRLCNCKLTVKKVDYFKKIPLTVPLRYLDLSNNIFDDQATYQITTWTWFSNFTRIEHLDLSNCRLQANKLIEVTGALKRINSIRYLDLSVRSIIESKLNSVADHIAKLITNNKNVEYLYLKNLSFSPYGLKHILKAMARISSLKQVVLNKACFDNDLVKYLAVIMAANQNLVNFEASSLLLNCDKRHDFKRFEQLELRKIKALQSIKINAVNLTEKDEVGLVIAIRNSPSIEILSVHNCKLLYNTKIDIFTALKKSTSLKQLSFVNIPIIDEVAYKVADAVLANKRTITDLEFNRCDLLSQGLLKCVDVICQCESLIYLNLSHNKVVGQQVDTLLSLLSCDIKLQHLILQKCELTTDDISKIASAVKNFSSFRCIDLSLNYMESAIVDKLAAAISTNKMISKVVLPTCTLKDGNVEIIASACSSVSKLQYIDLSFTYVTADLVKHFAGIFINNQMLKEVKIVKLALNQDGLMQMSQHLSKIVGLKHFSITDCQITGRDENGVFMAIQRNHELLEFSLAGCKISDHGVSIILSQLTFIASLTLLHLNGINIPSESEDTIALVITNNSKLKHLEMAGCNFRDFGIKKVFHALKNHSNLLYLNFSHNKLSIETFKSLVDVIVHLKSLEQLRLTDCGEISFSKVLKLLSLPKLTVLNMSNNTISGSAFQNVNRGINNCLHHLNFTNCNLSVENAETLVSTLRNCRSPVKLVLNSNPIPASMAAEFQRILTF